MATLAALANISPMSWAPTDQGSQDARLSKLIVGRYNTAPGQSRSSPDVTALQAITENGDQEAETGAWWNRVNNVAAPPGSFGEVLITGRWRKAVVLNSWGVIVNQDPGSTRCDHHSPFTGAIPAGAIVINVAWVQFVDDTLNRIENNGLRLLIPTDTDTAAGVPLAATGRWRTTVATPPVGSSVSLNT